MKNKILFGFVFSFVLIFTLLISSNFVNAAEIGTIKFTPASGAVKSEVTITGVDLTNNVINEILFNNITAIQTETTPVIKVSVPAGATSGKITIKTKLGDYVSTEIFKVDGLPAANAPVASTSTDYSPTDPDTGKKVEFTGIIPVCNRGEIDPVTNQYKIPCNFNYFMILINSIINFVLFKIATPFIALIIIYVAYLYLTSGGSNQTEKAKHILFNAIIGYVIALAAWLIINTIISTLGVDPDINTFMDRLPK